MRFKIQFRNGPLDGKILECDRTPNLYFESPVDGFFDWNFAQFPESLGIPKAPLRHVYTLETVRGPVLFNERYEYLYKGIE